MTDELKKVLEEVNPYQDKDKFWERQCFRRGAKWMHDARQAEIDSAYKRGWASALRAVANMLDCQATKAEEGNK